MPYRCETPRCCCRDDIYPWAGWCTCCSSIAYLVANITVNTHADECADDVVLRYSWLSLFSLVYIIVQATVISQGVATRGRFNDCLHSDTPLSCDCCCMVTSQRAFAAVLWLALLLGALALLSSGTRRCARPRSAACGGTLRGVRFCGCCQRCV